MKVLALALVLAVPAMASHGPKSYQTGKLLDYEKSSEQVVSTNYSTGAVQSHREVTRHIAIQGPENIVYFADFRVHLFKSLPDLIENAAIQYRVEKNDIWFLDGAGNEYKGRISKRRKPE